MNSKITKQLFKLIILTLLISYGIDKLLFMSLNKISDKVMTGQAIGKLNHFISLKDKSDFIVFGNSRANRHINVDLLSNNGFNMGIDGIGIAYSSTLINTLPIETEQFILVHIDTKNFFNQDYDGSDIGALKVKYKRDPKITEALNKSNKISTLQKFYYSINYNGNVISLIKNYFKPSYNFNTYNGYDPITVSESQEATRDTILSRSLISPKCNDDHKINPIALNYLKSIKSYSENSPNKTFLFVTSPIYNDTCPIDNLELKRILLELNLTYWDFSNLYKENRNNSYWKDATHMSKEGAEAFTKYLLNSIHESF